MELFKQSTFDEAIDYINILKNEIIYYPEHLAEYLKRDCPINNFF